MTQLKRIPDEAGLTGTKEIIELLKKTGENDLVICLISGGWIGVVTFSGGKVTMPSRTITNKLSIMAKNMPVNRKK